TDGDCLYLGAACPENHVLRLRRTDDPRVDLLSLAAGTRSVVDTVAERVGRHLQALLLVEPGVRQTVGGGYGLRFLDCDGRTVEVASDMAMRAFRPLEQFDSRPKAISHVVFNTPNLTVTREFYESVLGFRVSDWIEDFFCFMRTGKAHHILAFVQSPHSSLNHVAFEVRGLDEFMRATGGMMRNGYPLVWGPGRHGVGNNTFSYFQDPSSGFVMEYTTELELVDDEHGWTPTIYPAEHIDLWGTANPLDEAVRTLMRGRPDPGLWTPPPV
ncbi:MAG: VOC family protein, partial [Candidatus Dormibacteria bacterium]